jgi:hypothetical protein
MDSSVNSKEFYPGGSDISSMLMLLPPDSNGMMESWENGILGMENQVMT